MCTEETSSNISGFVKATKIPQRTKSSLLNFETDIIWHIALQVFLLHAIGIYGIFTFNYSESLLSTLWIFGAHLISILGMSAGAHRLWSHKSYKAKLPLRILLMLCFSMCGQNTLCSWVKNHRLHHKYCDTNADPHNAKRGIIYSHVGWVMMKEHPEYTKKSKQIDLSDILSDPVVIFNEKYFLALQLIFCFILPTIIPVYIWNETWSRAIMSQVFIRYILNLNTVWTINSIAHIHGHRPYNKNIKPADNDLINWLSVGDGYHNYHHVFPWDYRSAEIGISRVNYVTFLIEIFAILGQAYDLKYPSPDLVKKIAFKTGDGSHPMWSEVPIS